ncbi:MAG TPA: hypothetical protein VJR71_10265 [Pseudolabrys sp.]|nr:hypothetical protein [Pseudolabrys sp.]
MASETTARVQTQQRDTPGEDEYQAFCAALSASARGRAFLAEYARRSRTTTTAPLLSAIERLHSTLAPDAATPGEALIKQKLRVLLDDIVAAQGELEVSIQAMKSAKLAELVAIVERRLADIMVPVHREPEPAARLEPASAPGPPAEDPRSHLAVVPPPDQPELPIPAPAAIPAPAIVLVRHDSAKSEIAMAEIAFAAPAPPPVAPAQLPPVAASLPAPPQPQAATVPQRASGSADPLAPIMALSEEERLALFS